MSNGRSRSPSKSMNFSSTFRADLVVEGCVLIELKALERLAPVHGKQVLTYLRFMNLSVGLLMNFGAPTFREGLRRIVNGYDDAASRRR